MRQGGGLARRALEPAPMIMRTAVRKVAGQGRIGAFLIVAPILLIATAFIAFNGFVALFGFPVGYFPGFCFKWLAWCCLVSILILGPDGLRGMFRRADPPVGRPQWLGSLCLLLPPVVAYGWAIPALWCGRRINPGEGQDGRRDMTQDPRAPEVLPNPLGRAGKHGADRRFHDASPGSNRDAPLGWRGCGPMQFRTAACRPL